MEYSKKLRGVFGEYILVTLIHQDRDVCFNSNYREILYAIQDCFSFLKVETRYSECIFNKALCLPIDHAYVVPSFNKILDYYERHYLLRLNLLDKFFEKSIIDKVVLHENLKRSKKTIYINTFAYNSFYIVLPKYILKHVFSFLHTLSFEKSIKLRTEYEIFRKTLLTN